MQAARPVGGQQAPDGQQFGPQLGAHRQHCQRGARSPKQRPAALSADAQRPCPAAQAALQDCRHGGAPASAYVPARPTH